MAVFHTPIGYADLTVEAPDLELDPQISSPEEGDELGRPEPQTVSITVSQ